MRDADRIRFSAIGESGNEKLQGRTVALAGLGSVGSSITAMLGREDIELRLIDMGRVEETEMHRLALFHEEDITKFKVKQAKMRLAAINPNLAVKSFHEELTASNIFLLDGDVVIDATNDEEVNKLSLAQAAKKKRPLIIVRASASQARILVLQKAAPAKILDKLKLPPPSKAGIFGPVTSMAASLATAETLKILLGDKGSRLLECDAWDTKVKATKL